MTNTGVCPDRFGRAAIRIGGIKCLARRITYGRRLILCLISCVCVRNPKSQCLYRDLVIQRTVYDPELSQTQDRTKFNDAYAPVGYLGIVCVSAFVPYQLCYARSPQDPSHPTSSLLLTPSLPSKLFRFGLHGSCLQT